MVSLCPGHGAGWGVSSVGNMAVGALSAHDGIARDAAGHGGAAPEREKIDVSIIMPCLNEAGWLAACIANAREALDLMRETYGQIGRAHV